MLIKQIFYLLGCCLFLISCHSSLGTIKTDILSAQVTRVVNGQTIEVEIPQKGLLNQRVRILGLDIAALPDDKWRDVTRARLQELLANQSVHLELESTQPDVFGRLLAHIWLRQTLISEELAEEGYVLVNHNYPHKYSDRLFYAQEYARTLDYGIWQ